MGEVSRTLTCLYAANNPATADAGDFRRRCLRVRTPSAWVAEHAHVCVLASSEAVGSCSAGMHELVSLCAGMRIPSKGHADRGNLKQKM